MKQIKIKIKLNEKLACLLNNFSFKNDELLNDDIH